MSSKLWCLVEGKLDEHQYMAGVERTVDRVRATAEVFTPSSLVVEMLRYFDLDLLGPGKTVLDPACGDGQFLVAAKWIKVFHHGMAEEEALRDLYGIDIMRDNVDLCRLRLRGGTVVMGNALQPEVRLEGQTVEEHSLMRELFSEPASPRIKKRRVVGVRSRSRLETEGPAQMLF